MARVWAAAHAALGGDGALLFTALFLVVHTVAFFGLNALLYALQRGRWLQQYKIAPGRLPPAELQRRAWVELAVSGVLVNPLVMYYGVYPLLRARLDVGEALPSLAEALAHIAVFMVCEDTAFYWSHRMLHHRLLYKHVHKRHHEFKYNIGIAAEYDHLLESLVVYACLASGLLFVKTHVLVFYLWFGIRVVEAVDSHSGYRFPWSPFQVFDRIQGGAERHEFHHSHNVGSYGSWFCFWDWLMGTDVAYRAYQITQTTNVHRRTFDVRTRKFTLNLADEVQRSTALKLHMHIVATAPQLDTWTDVTLDGRPFPDYSALKNLPSAGTLAFVVKQKGLRRAVMPTGAAVAETIESVHAQ